MAFDVDAYRKTLEPPSFTFQGITHTGRVLTFNEAVVLSKKLENVKAMGLEELKEVARDTFTKTGLDPSLIDSLLEELLFDGFMFLLSDVFMAALGQKRVPPAQN